VKYFHEMRNLQINISICTIPASEIFPWVAYLTEKYFYMQFTCQ
jgi:hypothetical protein